MYYIGYVLPQSPDYTIIPVKSDKLGSIPGGAPVPLSLNKCEDVTLTQGDQLYVIHHPQLLTGHSPQKYYRCHNGYQLKKIIGLFLSVLIVCVQYNTDCKSICNM